MVIYNKKLLVRVYAIVFSECRFQDKPSPSQAHDADDFPNQLPLFTIQTGSVGIVAGIAPWQLTSDVTDLLKQHIRSKKSLGYSPRPSVRMCWRGPSEDVLAIRLKKCIHTGQSLGLKLASGPPLALNLRDEGPHCVKVL